MNPSMYSSFSLMFERDMIVEVIEVPTLAPMMKGMPCLTDIAPEAAIATTIVVVVEEDWINTVDTMPTIKHSSGFSKCHSLKMLPDM